MLTTRIFITLVATVTKKWNRMFATKTAHMYSACYLSVIFIKVEILWQILVGIINVKFYGNVLRKLGFFHVAAQTHRCDTANIYILQFVLWPQYSTQLLISCAAQTQQQEHTTTCNNWGQYTYCLIFWYLSSPVGARPKEMSSNFKTLSGCTF